MAAERSGNTAMEVDQGGSVYARYTCTHTLQSITMPDTLNSFPDLSSSTQCNVDKCEHTESWVCLKCLKVLCGRYGDQHMIQHKDENKQHCIAMGCGDLSFWCYACDDYLDHLHIRRVFEVYKIAHVRKFKHEINNMETLMEKTNFTKQDQLEQELIHIEQKKAEKKWYKGPEILNRKWNKKDEIEYDSDPEHKDKKQHVHTGIILKINENQGGFGKIMIKDDSGAYGNYGLETISIKLPPATPQNTVQRKPQSKKATKPSQRSGTSHHNPISAKSYDYAKYRGYDDSDKYIAPMEYIPFGKLKYRKKQWAKGDDIQYDSDPDDADIMNDHIHKGNVVAMDSEERVLTVKLTTGHTVKVNMDKVYIGVHREFWRCGVCGFENGNKSKRCMVCSMNDIEITERSMRPEEKEEKEQETKDGDNDDVVMNETVPRFFVYGTLRDDDDSGALWTASWTAGCTAANGKIFGYKMYQRKGRNHPFAVKTGNDTDFIVGRIVSFKERNTFLAKRAKADGIEGYDGNKTSFFHRDIIEVENTDDNGQKVKAMIYFQDKPIDFATNKEFYLEIPNGDWLQRKQ